MTTPNRREWVLVLDGPEPNREAVETLAQKLRRTLGDPMLKVRRADESSVVFVVESSNDGFARIQEIIKKQQRIELHGSAIRRVFPGPISPQFIQQIPTAGDFEHSPRPLPSTLYLSPDLPIEIPCEQDDTQMSEIHTEQMRQAKLSFNCALPLGVIGILVAIWAAISWPQGQAKGAGFSISAIMEVLTFILLKFHSEMNRRLDEAQKEIRAQRCEDRRFLKALKIADPVKRDDVIARLLTESLEPRKPSPSRRKGKDPNARGNDDGNHR